MLIYLKPQVLSAPQEHWTASSNVIWTSPSQNAAGSMPLGNGELGINLWVEENGDLLFYLSRNDSYSEISQMCKVGKVRISLSPNPFAAGNSFNQTLSLKDGTCFITAGPAKAQVRLAIFVDAANPVVHVSGQSDGPVAVRVHVDSWRESRQKVPDGGTVWTLEGAPFELWQDADTFVEGLTDALGWYHRNETSPAFEETVKVQSLESIRKSMHDPLLHRTFGGWVTGDGLKRIDTRTLATPEPLRRFSLRVASPCEITPTAQKWLTLAENAARKSSDAKVAQSRTAKVWHKFWDRSWVVCDVKNKTESADVLSATGSTRHSLFGDDKGIAPEAMQMTVGRAHTLQRYMQACAGRGLFPIKFNGSIFTVEPSVMGKGDNPDWRRWGDCHWWQNVRMPYHAMLAAGDFDLMHPLFNTFEAIRPFAEARAQLYHHVQGCYFAETMTVWGTYANRDYGWDRTGREPNDVQSMYWRYAWNQGLELTSLMLDYYDYTQDRDFLKTRLLPMAQSVLKYFDSRFRKDTDGRIILNPTQAVETYWYDVVNDTPCAAGLNEITARLCALPAKLVTKEQQVFFNHMKAAAPVIPLESVEHEGKTLRRIAVAQKYNPKRSNVENPELFPIWPFKIYGLGKPMLEEARNAYLLRGSHNDVGWGYDSNAAAVLGLTDEAARILKVKILNSRNGYRWPATWGPNFDWLPDQCHGGNLMNTVHLMLLQGNGDRILLLPAWPKEWDVSFKLHAPRNTTVECVYRAGKIEKLVVTPKERLKDIDSPSIQLTEVVPSNLKADDRGKPRGSDTESLRSNDRGYPKSQTQTHPNKPPALLTSHNI
jgi:hypothetical protein